jgi:WD40 repeat protein
MKIEILFFPLVLLLSSTLLLGLGVRSVEAPAVFAPEFYGVQMLWNNSMQVNDVAISWNGRFIAAVNNTGLYYFAHNNSQSKWWYTNQSMVTSVAMSADGEYIIIGDNVGFIRYFNNATVRDGPQAEAVWQSIDMGGIIERGTLTISDDGKYVALGGTGVNTWYYANCTNRSGSGQYSTWSDYLSYDINSVDMSPDGNYLAVGGIRSGGGFVAFYANATNSTSSDCLLWKAEASLHASINHVAVSDDGYSVAATSYAITSFHYWENATKLSLDPNATWISDGSYDSLAMTWNGDKVVAGSVNLSLHYWDNARNKEGTQAEDWVRLDADTVYDVAMSKDGRVIAAAALVNMSEYKAFFFRPNGTLLGQFDLMQYSNIAAMSANGRITAIAGPGFDSLYIFETIIDTEPPTITDINQTPPEDSVQPQDQRRQTGAAQLYQRQRVMVHP